MADFEELVNAAVDLRDLQGEYDVTLKALAVLAERYLVETGDGAVIITDDELEDSPDIEALRVAGGVQIRTGR